MAGAFRLIPEKLRSMAIDAMSRRLQAVGDRVVAHARALAPVETGATRDSIGATWNASTFTLTVHVDTPQGVYQEFGFHHHATGEFIQNVFLRPALAMAPGFWSSAITTVGSFANAAEPYASGYAAEHGGSGRKRFTFGHGRFE